MTENGQLVIPLIYRQLVCQCTLSGSQSTDMTNTHTHTHTCLGCYHFEPTNVEIITIINNTTIQNVASPLYITEEVCT